MRVSYNERIMHYLHQDQRIGILDETASHVKAVHRRHPASLIQCSLYWRFEQGRISTVKYKVYGCGITIAALAWAAEYIENKNNTEIENLTLNDIITALEIPKAKHHCAAMVYDMVMTVLMETKHDYPH